MSGPGTQSDPDPTHLSRGSEKSISESHHASPNTQSGQLSRLKLGLLAIAVLVAVFAAVRAMSNPDLVEGLVQAAMSNPTAAIPLFAAANIVAPLVLLPAAPFLLLAGGMWGMAKGMAISGSATFVSNILAFAIGRQLLQKRISGYVTRSVPSFPAIQAAILAEGWRLVLMLRLSPILPDSIMNYTLSLTNINFGLYAAATAVSTPAWAMLYLYLGSASQDIVATLKGGGGSSASADGAAATSWLTLAVTAASVVLVVGALVYMGKVIKNAIAKAEKQ